MESVSPRRRQAIAELRAMREQTDDPEMIDAIDRCIVILLEEDEPST